MSGNIKFLKSIGITYKKKYIELEHYITSNIKSKVFLTNNHFKNGTVIIDPQYYLITNESGVSTKVVGATKNIEFILQENITFNPNSVASLTPTPNEIARGARVSTLHYNFYPQDAYGLGFFCAISIYSSNIILNLNGFEIKQSSEHALQQRFYSNIELASIPFLPSQGPHTFGSKIKYADRCIIKDGVLGRSAHHSIHGNLATNIIIKNITAYDYEVGILGLNGVRNIYIDHLRGQGHRTDVPVLGIFSSARFIWPFLDALETYAHRDISGGGGNGLENGSYTKTEYDASGGIDSEWNAALSTIRLNISGGLDITSIKTQLEQDLSSVYTGVINSADGKKKTTTSVIPLYKNHKGIVDGNSYGILINQIGVAVNGFPVSRQEPSENIYINDVIIKNHTGFINEIPALENSTYPGTPEKDPVGSVFQTQNRDASGAPLTINSNGTYKGNAVSNAQLVITKAIEANEFFFNGECAADTPCVKRNSITDRTVQWAESEAVAGAAQTLSEAGINYLFNGDSMFHVNKGLVTCKLDAIEGLYVDGCVISNCHNKTDEWPRSSDTLTDWGPPNSISDEQKQNYTLYSNGLGKSHLKSTYNGSTGHDIRAWSLSSSRNCLIQNCSTRNVSSNLGQAIGYDVHQDSDNIYLINCSSYNIDGGTSISGTAELVELSKHREMKLPKCIGYRAGPKTHNIIFQDCTTDGINDSPLTNGINSIEILSSTAINIKT